MYFTFGNNVEVCIEEKIFLCGRVAEKEKTAERVNALLPEIM